MEQTKEQVQPKTEQISQAEINKRQAQMAHWFSEQNKKLKLQAEYERLRRQIAEDRLKEFNYSTTLQMLIAQSEKGLVETPEDLIKAQGGEVPESNLKVEKGAQDE